MKAPLTHGVAGRMGRNVSRARTRFLSPQERQPRVPARRPVPAPLPGERRCGCSVHAAVNRAANELHSGIGGANSLLPRHCGRSRPRMLQMAPETMRELAHHVTEILVQRIDRLPGDRVWEGDFKDALAQQLAEDPPETGRPAREIVDRAARDVLSNTLRLDHPRSFGFVPTCPTWPGVLADFMASGFNVNVATWLTASGPSQLEAVVIGWFRTLRAERALGSSEGSFRTLLRSRYGCRRPMRQTHGAVGQSGPHRRTRCTTSHACPTPAPSRLHDETTQSSSRSRCGRRSHIRKSRAHTPGPLDGVPRTRRPS